MGNGANITKSFNKPVLNKNNKENKKLKRRRAKLIAAISSITICFSLIFYSVAKRITNVPPSGFCISAKNDISCLYFGKYKERLNELKHYPKEFFKEIPNAFIILFPEQFRGKRPINSGFHESLTGIMGVVLDEETKLNIIHEFLHKIYDQYLTKEDKDKLKSIIDSSLEALPYDKYKEVYSIAGNDNEIENKELKIRKIMEILKIGENIASLILKIAVFNNQVRSIINNSDDQNLSELFAFIGTNACLKPSIPLVLYDFYKKANIKNIDHLIDQDSLTLADIEKIKELMENK